MQPLQPSTLHAAYNKEKLQCLLSFKIELIIQYNWKFFSLGSFLLNLLSLDSLKFSKECVRIDFNYQILIPLEAFMQEKPESLNFPRELYENFIN